MDIQKAIQAEIEQHERAVIGLRSALAALNGTPAVRHVRYKARVSTRKLVLRVLAKSGGTASASQIHELIRKRGHDLSWRACWAAVRKLKEAKEIKRVRRGVYALVGSQAG